MSVLVKIYFLPVAYKLIYNFFLEPNSSRNLMPNLVLIRVTLYCLFMQLIPACFNDLCLFFTHDFWKVSTACTAPRPFLLLTGGWVCTSIWVGTQLAPADERDHMVSCSVYRAEEKNGGTLGMMTFVFPSNH